MDTACPTCHRPFADLTGPGQVGNNHPSTSRNAAVTVQAGTQRWQLLTELADRADATVAEIADDIGMSRNQLATRMLELHQAGLAELVYDDDGNPCERATSARANGRVHRASAHGRYVLAAISGDPTRVFTFAVEERTVIDGQLTLGDW